MKISVEHIRYYKDKYNWSGDPMPDGIDTLTQKIGAQLGEIEEVTDLGKKYQGVLVAKVVECKDHENSDHLHVCKIDDGGKAEGVERDENGHVQVVCGAPNVREGILVAWLPPGCTVPESYGKDPFVLEARELRGVVSNGMLASPRELAIGDQHEGILEIDEDAAPGTPFADVYGLNDYVIDIENKMFTHRPDCFGMMGVAREIVGIQQQQFTSPDWYRPDAALPTAEQETLRVEVNNELPELVPRFLALPMSNVTVGPSPFWLQVSLARVGIRPINNVVDLTNYYMILTGQPTHAYDYDKVMAQDNSADHATLTVRYPHEGEKILLLNGKEIEPRPEAIMIASRDKLIGVGGVMGGGDTEVDENTKNIIIEVATFDMYSIRRTSMAHGLFTDAVTRFNKGQSPLQNRAVLSQLADAMQRLAGGKVAGAAVDDNHSSEEVMQRGSLYAPVNVTRQFVNERLGFDLSAEDMAQLLKNVEFHVEVSGDELTVTAPFWRTDIEIPEDVVEEVGRLYGFDHLPLTLPKRTITPTKKDELLELKSRVRDVLSKAGANEVLTYSFVHGNLLDKVGQNKAEAFQIGNAISPDLQYYRLSLAPSLLDKIHANVKAGYDEFALFEMGKMHSVSEMYDGIPEEFDRVALVYAANKKTAAKQSGAAFYQARAFADELLSNYGIEATYQTFGEAADATKGHQYLDEMLRPFEPNRSAVVFNGDRMLGVVGEYRSSVQKALKLPEKAAGFELFLTAFAELQPASQYVQLSRFPKVEQDICLKVPADTTYQQVYNFVRQKLAEIQPANTLPSLSPVDIYQRENDTAHKQITLRLSIASYDRTLTDEEVGKLLDHVADAAHQTLQAERV